MASRSLNKVQLIGNLTRDPELRYTPQGTAVCTFSVATNRSWVTESGEKKEEAEFHRLVAWNKLAEICSQFLSKGRRTYVEGRLRTRQWTGQDGSSRQTTEIVISEMIILDSRRSGSEATRNISPGAPVEEFSLEEPVKSESKPKAEPAVEKSTKKSLKKEEKKEDKKEITEDEIPF